MERVADLVREPWDADLMMSGGESAYGQVAAEEIARRAREGDSLGAVLDLPRHDRPLIARLVAIG